MGLRASILSRRELFERVCELDLEGIVAKHKHAPYVTEREESTWFKILNRGYSQKAGREEVFVAAKGGGEQKVHRHFAEDMANAPDPSNKGPDAKAFGTDEPLQKYLDNKGRICAMKLQRCASRLLT